ncbi:trophoblast glycoprotein-like [Daphnia pulex]|uniref:LRRCT domain-containing protein n=1 Tax=Daphnia pulex TaxID=6669 RepID=E9GKJ0_DAPPU|nr:trophoblast glycoprotein-like [Daphnia pulex]XP_046462452.1 trophoblast glycoprotein-like [Daphnia pulex]XP_046657926.1 trophoblast glycoprotein-like [Daphnia pulicaria]XP_046657927.1 trophoblast glycoprotein-like [Daphnia pulicaria]EFX80004.1 hypothetical protein DAPPUDRAFT_103849 [Daphnia pulex]|eukprot:EFX80004.1 hypothetical protein DAPPUDRAFT_103849 [Daphnia pulex]
MCSKKPAPFIYVFLIMTIIKFSSAVTCPPDFGDRCICGKANYNGKPRFLVNCTNTQFNDAAMLEKLPIQTEVVIFTGNNITSMPWNVFGKMNDYPDLEVIDMTNNNIKEIKGKTYHHVRNVKTLILNHNQLNITGDKTHPRIFSNFVNLESLHLTNAFSESVDSKEYLVALEQIFVGSNLTKLSKVHLEQNEIWSIKNPNIFCSLPSLMDIQLGDNNISEMNFNVGCIQNLRFIDLRNNKIHNLSNNTLSKFEELPEQGLGVKLDLMGNPFICDCQIADLLNWLRTTKVDVLEKESYSCYDGFPVSNINQQLYNVHQIQCAYAPKQEYQGTTVLLGILLFLMTSLILIIGYMNFTNVRARTVALWEKVFHRGQYTHILSKPEEQEVHV